MQINRLSTLATDTSKKVGHAILNTSGTNPKLRDGLLKANKFFQGESYNPGRGAYYGLMTACVILPRLLEAREPDEFREILTRDVTSVATILFAMKALKSGMCTAAQKKAGYTLVKDTVGKDANFMKRIGGYFNPEGGIIALGSDEILARYSSIKDRDSLVKLMKTVDKEGGDLSKMFAVEKQKGFITKIKENLPFVKNKSKETPLYDAAKQMFGGEFNGKTNQELIDIVSNITENSGTALEGLESIVGSFALGAKELAEGTAKKGILNEASNPITKYARNIAANFETISLAITAGFLGFGLPKINEKLTMKKHLNKPGINPNRATKPEDIKQAKESKKIYQSLENNEKQVFQSFLGNA